MKILHGVTVYSFAGWVLESVYSKAVCGRFLRPHFSWLPFKPMYGIAAMLLVKVPHRSKLAQVVAVSGIPTMVEFISGYWLRRSYGLQYWDYSDERGNVQGLICPKFMAYWAVLGSFLLRHVQPNVERLLKASRKRGEKFLTAATVLLLTDVHCNLWRRAHDKRRTKIGSCP